MVWKPSEKKKLEEEKHKQQAFFSTPDQ